MIGSKALFLCLTLATLNIAALAQEKKVEVAAHLGYTAASGFDIDPAVNINGAIVDRIGVDSGISFGFQGDYLMSDKFAVGFLWARQSSKLTSSGFTPATGLIGGTVNIADMPIYNYLGVATYNFGEVLGKVRPYALAGMGATVYSPGDFVIFFPDGGSVAGNFGSKTKFALTFGGGVKFFVSESLGFKASARWTPTYIGSQPNGIWCNDFYCIGVESSKWSNQGEFSGGVIFRF
jgi:opacity protein-like surface antigen